MTDVPDPIRESCESIQTLEVSADPEPRLPKPGKEQDQSDTSTQPQMPSEKLLVSTDTKPESAESNKDPSSAENFCAAVTAAAAAAAETEEDQSQDKAQVSEANLGSDTVTRGPAVREEVQLSTEEGIKRQHSNSEESTQEDDYELITSLEVPSTKEDQTGSPGPSKTLKAKSGRVYGETKAER